MPADPYLIPLLLIVLIAVVGYFVYASFLFGAGYQPTPRAAALEMLRLAELTPRDTLYDLGAGTGALIFRAVRIYRVRAVGVEVEPIRFLVLRIRRALAAEPDQITLHWGNLFALDFREASVVATFLWPGAMDRLRPKLEASLPPGARVVSHCHPIPGWTAEVYDERTDVYLYRWPDAARAPGPGAPTTGGT